MSADEWTERMAKVNLKPTVEATAFAKEFNLSVNSLMFELQHPTFMSAWYKVQTVEEMLELEFTKMLEQNIRFRKCKRCGRYFIMNGNYETRYCDRVAPGRRETVRNWPLLKTTSPRPPMTKPSRSTASITRDTLPG